MCKFEIRKSNIRAQVDIENCLEATYIEAYTNVTI